MSKVISHRKPILQKSQSIFQNPFLRNLISMLDSSVLFTPHTKLIGSHFNLISNSSSWNDRYRSKTWTFFFLLDCIVVFGNTSTTCTLIFIGIKYGFNVWYYFERFWWQMFYYYFYLCITLWLVVVKYLHIKQHSCEK